MTENVYKTPESNVNVKAKKEPRPVKAIIITVLIDIVGTIIVTLIAGIAYGVILAMQGTPPEEIKQLSENMDSLGIFSITASTLGLIVSVIAGYACARISVQNVYRNALIAGIIISVISLLLSPDIDNILLTVLLYMLSFGALFFGAWLHQRRATTQ